MSYITVDRFGACRDGIEPRPVPRARYRNLNGLSVKDDHMTSLQSDQEGMDEEDEEGGAVAGEEAFQGRSGLQEDPEISGPEEALEEGPPRRRKSTRARQQESGFASPPAVAFPQEMGGRTRRQRQSSRLQHDEPEWNEQCAPSTHAAPGPEQQTAPSLKVSIWIIPGRDAYYKTARFNLRKFDARKA